MVSILSERSFCMSSISLFSSISLRFYSSSNFSFYFLNSSSYLSYNLIFSSYSLTNMSLRDEISNYRV